MKKNFIVSLIMMVLSIQLVGQTPDRSVYPKPGPLNKMIIPSVESFTLKNGLPVYYVKKDQLPLVQMNLYVHAGAAYEKPTDIGLTSITASLMLDGAGKRNALELADEIDFLGINLNSYGSSEVAAVTLFAPESRLDASVALFADVLTRPTFPETELERRRKNLLTSLVQNFDEARYIASQLFNLKIFGENHPYAPNPKLSEAAIRGYSIKQIKEFHKKVFTPKNAFMIVVGSATKKEIQEMLEKHLAHWKGGEKLPYSPPSAPKTIGRKIYLVDKPGAAQTEVRVGSAGVDQKFKEEYALEVMNTILGGSFSSRLNQNIRETHGYAYGANTGFTRPKGQGYFIASSAVQTDVTDKALNEFFKELTAITSVSDDEMDRARNYVALGFPSDFESVQSIASAVFAQVLYKYPKGYYETYVDNILSVTKTQAESVAKQLVDPSNVVIILVGDKSKILEGVKALNLGEIIELSAEDVLGPIPQL